MRAHTNTLKVCFVIPAYNEASVIGEVITALSNAANNAKFTYKIVVINDGSRDTTAKEAEKHGATVISHILNSGSGSATATGLSYAQQNDYDIAATLDADGQHSPEDVITGIKLLQENNFDLLIGSRLIDSQGMSKVKVFGNKGLSIITYIIFGINVTDSQSGMRIFSKKALTELKWKTSGYEYCSEMLWRAKQIHLTISEYPIKAIYTDYSKSKGQNNWNAFNIIKLLVQRRLVEIFGE